LQQALLRSSATLHTNYTDQQTYVFVCAVTDWRAAFYTDPTLDRSGRERLSRNADALVTALQTARVLPVHNGKSAVQVAADGFAQSYSISGAAADSIIADTAGAAFLMHLGSKDDQAVFGLHIPAAHSYTPQGEGVQMLELRKIADALVSDDDSAVLCMARGLSAFHSVNLYCAKCGAQSAPHNVGTGRKCTSDSCRASLYPRLDPAVIVMVLNAAGTHCLLGRKKAWPPGRVSCLAGFVELGESFEETVLREVFEESGVRVDPSTLQYHTSQPWLFPQSQVSSI
jgi:NAD+ diphosphatase